jgi:hypothetical protein
MLAGSIVLPFTRGSEMPPIALKGAGPAGSEIEADTDHEMHRALYFIRAAVGLQAEPADTGG